MEDCQVGILVDVSEPEVKTRLFSCSSQEDDKENCQPLTDSIEIERSADTERRLSLTLKSSDDIQNRILRDVTEQSLPNSAKKCLSPVVRLIDEETFDFDLAVSPAIRAEDLSREEEDEVFFGPVGFTERLKQTFVQEVDVPPLSPLNAEQFALMVKEANYVAYRIKNSQASSGSESSPSVSSKPSCSSVEEETTPSKRKHSRSSTFTKCQSPLELLPEEIRNGLPVIDDSKIKLPAGQNCDNTVENNCSNGLTKGVDINKKETDDASISKKETDDASINKKEMDDVNINKEEIDDVNNKVIEKESKKDADLSISKQTTGRRLKPPSKLPGSKLAQPKIKYASSCESLDSRASGHESDSNCSIASDNSDMMPPTKPSIQQSTGKTGIPKTSKLRVPGSTINRSFNSSMNCSLNSSTSESSAKVGPKTSRLAALKVGGNNYRGITPKSGAPCNQLSNSERVKKSDLNDSIVKKQEQKSTEPLKRSSSRLSAKPAVNGAPKTVGIPTLKGPIGKPSLMKPGELQKRVNKGVTGNGPMKATQPVEKLNSTYEKKTDNPKPSTRNSVSASTPVKQDKCVKPKLLANNFTTTSVSSSTSTPISGRRKSCLPTTKNSRSSLGSIPGSPLMRRLGSSTSSRQSQLSSCSSSVSESPVFNNSMSRSRIVSTKKTAGQYSNLEEMHDKSPSSMKVGKSRVVHTPQLPQKVQSKWSPIRRPRPISQDEEVIQCTKRKL